LFRVSLVNESDATSPEFTLSIEYRDGAGNSGTTGRGLLGIGTNAGGIGIRFPGIGAGPVGATAIEGFIVVKLRKIAKTANPKNIRDLFIKCYSISYFKFLCKEITRK